MKKILFLLSCFIFTGVVQAVPLTNGSFESGLSGWSTTGNVSVVNSYTATTGASSHTTLSPTAGNGFAVIKAGTPVSSLASIPFAVTTGTNISFDWFFSAEEYLPYNDLSGFSLDLVSGNVTVVADILSSVFDVGSWGLTGWNTASMLSPVSGDVSLKFYSMNSGDFLFDSVLGIDNVRAVPAPAPLALLGLGLAVLGYQQRQKATGLQRTEMPLAA